MNHSLEDQVNKRLAHFQLHPSRLSNNRRILIAAIIVCALFATALSNNADPLRYRSGFRNSGGEKKLNEKQLDLVLRNLREKTGFLELFFNQDGFLQLGDRAKFLGGSSRARALIEAAIRSNDAIDLESHENSPIVAFGRLAKPVIYQSRRTGESMQVYPVELDFNDFSRLRGDKKALAAFDIGFVIMHELAHAVLNLSDSIDGADSIGDCETHINSIRRELNLPERQHYFAKTFPVSTMPTLGTTHQAELLFTQSTQVNDRLKHQKFSLIWEARLVGPVRPPVEIDSVAGMRNKKPINASVNGQ